MEGFLIIDTSGYDEEQSATLQHHVRRNNGWPHPDNARWIIPTDAPATTSGQLALQGLPPESIKVAR